MSSGITESLFAQEHEDAAAAVAVDALQPLAARIRPCALNDFIGRELLLRPGNPLGETIRRGLTHSMIL